LGRCLNRHTAPRALRPLSQSLSARKPQRVVCALLSKPRVPSRSTQKKEESAGYSDGFPQVFGKYVLLRPMARGGMGELFLAAAGEVGGFEKLCVVKKVLHSLSEAAVHRRFLDEAKVVVRLNHANLVQVFDAGKVDEEYYLAMELVEGKDLRAVWNRCAQLHRRIPVDVAIFVIREVMRGLDYVHDALDLNLVHRDISPPNILVGYRGDVKLTDFGLAKSSIKREMTSPGVVFGRYSYLSPEQAKGLPADRRTDIYATAIVLWELLTGRQLFPSTNRSHQDALSAVRDPKVKPPSQVVPGVPAGMDEIVLRGLAKSPADRYESAGVFRSSLSDILARDYPKCNADRVAEFMADIFAREVKLEAREYTAFAREDFADLRATAEDSELISIKDTLNPEGGEGGTMLLGEADIVEVEHAPRPWDEGQADARSLHKAAQAWVGKVVGGRYRVDSLLGVGGMGAVFRVTHIQQNRPCALKLLRSVYARGPEAVARLAKEARGATATGHPNIADVLDVGTTDDGNAYYVMESLQGRHVERVIKADGPLPIRRAVHIARQVCRALSAAHEAGIIHRDLKAENIVLIQRGKDPDFVKVLDFGISKQMNADSETAAPGLIMGSPGYMAPEQGAGMDATVSSDVYSLGCILFESLTGRLPFIGRNAIDVLMQKGARSAPRVTEFRPETPVPLADVIGRCLERQPSDRPASMRSLEVELTRAIDGRANAASVLGSGAYRELETHEDERLSPSASMSMQRAAIAASLDDGSVYGATKLESKPWPGPSPSADAPMGPSEEEEIETPERSPGGVGRALLFVLLGGFIATGAVMIMAPETVTHATRRWSNRPTSETRGAIVDEGSTESPVVGPTDASAPPVESPTGVSGVDPGTDDPNGLVPDVDDAGVPTVVGPNAPESTVRSALTMNPRELVELANRALEAGNYRDPYENSVAIAMAQLQAMEPSNENISKLRQAAADKLMPRGTEALSQKSWDQAASAFRDLLGIWPAHNEAKDGLVESLHGLSVVLRRSRKFDGALAAADEILNHQPDDFKAVLLRADMLFELERWEEARDTYARARKLKPYSEHVRTRYQRAKRNARKSGN